MTQYRYVIATPLRFYSFMIIFWWCHAHSFIQCPRIQRILGTFHFDTYSSLQRLSFWAYKLSFIVSHEICRPQCPIIRLLLWWAWVMSKLRSYWVTTTGPSSSASLCLPTSHALCGSLNYIIYTPTICDVFRPFFVETLASDNPILKFQFYIALTS